ncbi:MAG: hypothetical protein FJW26_14210 [Acidimicrobiia bacterium]|nr:hypothetical protein [Acidimicrobiia bacterium]
MQFARGVRELDLAWLEEPVRWHDQIDGNARVQHHWYSCQRWPG